MQTALSTNKSMLVLRGRLSFKPYLKEVQLLVTTSLQELSTLLRYFLENGSTAKPIRKNSTVWLVIFMGC
jgi:hypothetical protein